ncbi:MAG: helix-turn-helix domain-containing protein [Oscillibacter sp.]|nr:helix-turn-helix domain-containing protein [Oscillibacter sp.]
MAGYAFRTFDERKKIENLWEAGTSAKDIATELNISASALYTELRRGQDGTRLPDQRRRYNADLAQLRVQQSLERRGRKAMKGESEHDQL